MSDNSHWVINTARQAVGQLRPAAGTPEHYRVAYQRAVEDALTVLDRLALEIGAVTLEELRRASGVELSADGSVFIDGVPVNEPELAQDPTGVDCWERYEGVEP